MTIMQIRKLKRTIKPVIKKTLLKQVSSAPISARQRMQSKLIDKMVREVGLMVKDKRKKLAQGSVRAFPTKQVILNFQNEHLANGVGKKLLGLARQKLHSQEIIPQDITAIERLISDGVFDDVSNKLPSYEKYMDADRAKLARKISQLKKDLRLVKQKLQAERQKRGSSDPTDPALSQHLSELVKQYGIAKTLKQIMRRSKQFVPIDVEQVDNGDQYDYDQLVFDESRKAKYPKSFVKKMRGRDLRNLVDKYVGHGGYDIGGVLDEHWSGQPQVVQGAVNDVVCKYLTPLGVEDPMQIDRIKQQVSKRIRKGVQ